MVLTPRFRNSSNLVFMLLGPDGSQPVQVAKVSRLAGPSAMMEREAALLRDIEARRPGGFDSIPRVVAFETFRGHGILVQTAITGSALDRATVRRSSRQACGATLAWMIDVQTATRLVPDGDDGFERLIERELSGLKTIFPREERLIERTRELVRPLALARLPRVLEHRDLSHPNLILGPGGRIGVIDWEQGELEGLPAADLFFFLRYVGMALSGARANEGSTRVLDLAFFGRRSWARGPVARYAGAMGLEHAWLTPLFVATWMRQVHGLAQRVASSEGGAGPEPGPTADWLSKDWRFAAWRHGIEQVDRLDWDDVP
jgi:aminoglycoside phosphotransferase